MKLEMDLEAKRIELNETQNQAETFRADLKKIMAQNDSLTKEVDRVCVCVCVCVYTYIYIHTCIYMFIHTSQEHSSNRAARAYAYAYVHMY